MASAEAVARHLLHLAASGEEPSPVTHMQLQKLLYYVQGWSLASRGEPAFGEMIEAWEHGPVVRAVYPLFAGFGSGPVPTEESRAEGLSERERVLVEAVWERYGRYSASYLRRLTHGERPWMEARGDAPEGAPGRAEISLDSMREFFAAVQAKHLRRWGIEAAELEESIRQARAGDVETLIAGRGGRAAG